MHTTDHRTAGFTLGAAGESRKPAPAAPRPPVDPFLDEFDLLPLGSDTVLALAAAVAALAVFIGLSDSPEAGMVILLFGLGLLALGGLSLWGNNSDRSDTRRTR